MHDVMNLCTSIYAIYGYNIFSFSKQTSYLDTLNSEDEDGALVVLVGDRVQQAKVLEPNGCLHVQHAMKELVTKLDSWR